MKVFDYKKLKDYVVDQELLSLITEIYQYKGKQDIFLNLKQSALDNMQEQAFLSSTESSNRIEGIVTTTARLKKIIKGDLVPKSRNEQEIAGYKNALRLILDSYDLISITKNHVLQIHQTMISPTKLPYGGRFKSTQNYIVSVNKNNERTILFIPLSPFETPIAIEELFKNFNDAVENSYIDQLILLPYFIHDFLCIHPFDDGNGRVSRLLTTLILLKFGFKIFKYVSLDAQIESHREWYYNALQDSHSGWINNNHNPQPFIKFLLTMILYSLREAENKYSVSICGKNAYSKVKFVIDKIVGRFTKDQIAQTCTTISKPAIEIALKQLCNEGYIEKNGKGKATYYVKKNS